MEGIEVSLPQRLQLLEVLQRFGRDLVDHPADLKYKIAPILAKNAGQQDRIHRLFEAYLAEAMAYSPPPPPVQKRWYQKLQRWHWGIIALAIFIIPLITIEEGLRTTAVEPSVEARFNIPATVSLGGHLPVLNSSLHVDTLHTEFHWQLFDKDRGERELDTLVNTWTWQLPMSSLGESANKFLLLTATDTLKKDTSTYKKSFQVNCAVLPEVPTIIAPIKAYRDSVVLFKIAPEAVPGLRYTWKLQGGELDSVATELAHVFRKAGVYQMKLHVRNTQTAAYCQVDTLHTITITNKNDEKAYLAEIPLQIDEAQGTTSQLKFFWMSGLLLGLLFLYALYQCWRWLNQKPPEVSEAERQEELDERFASSDRGPYNIPFENYESSIQVEENLFRLADKLRKRQEDERRILDIQASVRQTIDQGGFPVLLEKRTSLPPEYLFLIDEQAERSHQAELYKYLVTFLRDKDVFINTFRYNGSFHRFWNADFPDGISLERLRQLYPLHRLVVLGDGLDLMDQRGEELQLKADYEEVLEEWASRLLLTPVPPASWTYKEATLYQLFPIFDSDASGFSAALKHLDVLAEEADDPGPRPSFTDWQTQQTIPPEQPDINHRIWRKLSTYQDYFSEYRQVYRWFCALAVYPEANWQLTLAIGQAIKAPVNFDNLLLLSRIPWLQGKPLHPKLRQQLLEELDPATEEKARKAVQQALAEVAPKVVGSHVNTALQTNLAIQSFLLAPEDVENRALIEQLQRQKMLGKRQLIDLDGGIKRKTRGTASSLQAYMSEAGETTLYKADAPLFFNNAFYQGAFAATMAIILGLFMLSLNGTERLYEWVKGETTDRVDPAPKTPAEYWYFFKEENQQDSAIIYNNWAVGNWSRSVETTDQDSMRLFRDSTALNLGRALSLRDDYEVALRNRAKLQYNEGVNSYHVYLDGDQEPEQLTAATRSFTQAIKDSMIADQSQHALGLCHYYAGRINDATREYAELEVKDFFATFPLEPNLKSLIDPAPPAFTGEGCNPTVAFSLANEVFCQGDEVVLINDSPSDENFEYFILDWGDGVRDSLTTFEQTRHTFQRGRAWTVRMTGFIQCDSTGLISRSIAQRVSSLAPAVAPLGEERSGCPPMTVAYYSTGIGDVQAEWRIVKVVGQGAPREQRSVTPNQLVYTSRESELRYTFEEAGTYQVWMYVQNACGRDSSYSTVTALSAADCSKEIVIAGRIVGIGSNDKAGRQPVGQAKVDWDFGNAITDDQGAFSIVLPEEIPSAITLDVEHPNFLETVQAFELNDKTPRTLTVTLQAKENDRDGDGILDSEDACPEQAGRRITEGCPDRDGDGTPDVSDRCPSEPGPFRNRGCPIEEEETQFELIFDNSSVKPRNLLGTKFFLPIENEAYIWPIRISRNKALVLINQDITGPERDTELFYGELEEGQSCLFSTAEASYRVTLQRIANVGFILTRGAYFRAEKAQTIVEDGDVRYTIRAGAYRNGAEYIQQLLDIAPKDWNIWLEEPIDQEGLQRLNIGVFETLDEAQKLLQQVKLLRPDSYVSKYNLKEQGKVTDLRLSATDGSISLDESISLYFDHDQPQPNYEQNRDYASFTDDFLRGFGSPVPETPSKTEKGRAAQETLKYAYASNSRVSDYLAANCNGDTNEVAVTRFFAEVRTNYNRLSSYAETVLPYYQKGYQVLIDIETVGAINSGAATNSLAARRLATLTEYFRNYFKKQGVDFDEKRISYRLTPKAPSAASATYPRTGKCSMYDVRVARDRKIQIVNTQFSN